MQTPPMEQTAREAAVGLEHLWAPAGADKVLASHRERPEALQAPQGFGRDPMGMKNSCRGTRGRAVPPGEPAAGGVKGTARLLRRGK